jgi:hypothetical protein
LSTTHGDVGDVGDVGAAVVTEVPGEAPPKESAIVI